MTIDLTSYRSIGNLTDWLVRFSIVMIILTVVAFAATSYQTLLVEYNPQFDKVYDITGIFILIVSILLNISLLFGIIEQPKTSIRLEPKK